MPIVNGHLLIADTEAEAVAKVVAERTLILAANTGRLLQIAPAAAARAIAPGVGARGLYHVSALPFVNFGGSVLVSGGLDGNVQSTRVQFPDALTTGPLTFAPVMIPAESSPVSVTASILWRPAAAVAGDVLWQIAFASLRGGLPAAEATGSPFRVASAHPLADQSYLVAVSVPFNVTDLAPGDFLLVNLRRLGGAVGDTLATDAEWQGLSLDFTLS